MHTTLISAPELQALLASRQVAGGLIEEAGQTKVGGRGR